MDDEKFITKLSEIRYQMRRSMANCEKRLNATRKAYIKEHARFKVGDIIQVERGYGPYKYGDIIRIKRIQVFIRRDMENGGKEEPIISYIGQPLYPDLTKWPNRCLDSILDDGREPILKLTEAPWSRFICRSVNGTELEFDSFTEAWRPETRAVYGVRSDGSWDALVVYPA